MSTTTRPDLLRRSASWIVPMCVVATSTLSCGGETGGEDAYTIRDSAGVRLVDNRAPQWAADEGWRVAEEPSVVIGVRGDAAQPSLHDVQGARGLPDGRIVIANDGSKELVFFDSAGVYLHSVGRQGEAPGEFEYLMALWLCGDSLRVYDGRLSRFSVFDRDGRFARSFQVRLPNRAQPPANIDCNDDGRLILSDWGDPSSGGQVYRPSITVMVADPNGAIADTVGSFPGHQYVRGFTSSPVFGMHTTISLADDRAYIGTADRYEISAYGLDGGLRTVVRMAAEAMPVTSDDISRYKNRELADVADPELRRRRQERLDEAAYAERFPAYGAFTHDLAGNLWVEEYRRPWEEGSRWTVFTREGVLLGNIALPRDLTILRDGIEVGQIGDDFILGVRRDELDVEEVVLHRLIK